RDKDGKPIKATVREDFFKVPGARPLVEDVEVYQGKSATVGVVGMVAPSVAAAVVGIDKAYDFEKVSARLPDALKKFDKSKPDLKVLLYQGSEIEAMQVAKDNPGIGLIVRASDDSEALAPSFSTPFPSKEAPTTQIVHVGHKGQNVGLVGVFKTDKGVRLFYQLVPLGEEYLTPEKVESKDHKLLGMLEKYTAEVKKDDLLKAYKRKDHPAQAKVEGLKYIGSEACVKCHAAEVKKWGESKHSHAFDALVKYATRPGLRQYDPDCVSCHTTGFGFTGGFESGEKTPKLLHNQCENCHGPGSGHAEKPTDKTLLELLAPWKLTKDDKVDKALLDKMAALPEAERGRVPVPATQRRLINQLQTMCMNCHDLDNDPKFDIWTYLPKIYHSGLGKSDLPPGIGK
nr:cytochrome c family protein [Fimbriiglobus sp.]